MDQPTFADLEYDSKKREDPSGDDFLERMDSRDPVGTARRAHPPVLSQGGPGPAAL